jgi:hypothetical protein
MVRQVNIHIMPLIRRSHFTSDLRSLLPVLHASGLPRVLASGLLTGSAG